jgi:protein-S-isoprenylcysteine O-methyltransferase Ste14
VNVLTLSTRSYCTNLPTFKITVTAGLYSQLAGLLAGFAFTALMLLATTRASTGKRNRAFSDATRILVAAFLSLLLNSVSYAVLAGDPGTDGRTASEEPILGVGFAIAGALVIYAIVSTLDAVNHLTKKPSHTSREVENSTRDALAVAFAPILVLYVYLGVQDYEDFRYRPCHPVTALDWLGWTLVFVQAVASLLIYPVLSYSVVRFKWSRPRVRYTPWVSRSLLIVSFITTVLYALVDSYLSASSTLPPIIPAGCMIAISLAMLGLVFHLGYTRQPVQKRHDEARQTDGGSSSNKDVMSGNVKLEVAPD